MAVKLKTPPLKPATRTVTKTTPVNYGALLANEPALQATLAQIQNQRLLNQGALTGGYQQTLGNLGEIPDLASLPENLRASLASMLDPNHLAELQGIVQQANQAGVSTLARNQYDYQHGQAQQIAGLAARGALQSSELGNLQNRNLHDFTLAQYDARQAALGSLGTAQNAYLAQQRSLDESAGTALYDAQKRIGDQVNSGQLAPLTTSAQVATPFRNPAAPRQPYVNGEPKPTGAVAPPPRKPAAPYRPSPYRLRAGSL